MSEKNYSRNQVLKIIVITWILSLITTLVVVNFVPANPKKSWHQFEFYEGTFIGSIDEPDYLFYEPKINADIWRISWHVRSNENPPQEDVLFYFKVSGDTVSPEYPRNYVTKEDFRSDRSGWYKKSEEGIEYFFGSGKKFLTIQGIKLDWKIIIEEYY